MDLELPSGFYMGYELEFCSKVPLTSDIKAPLESWFEFGRDGSLQPRDDSAHMYEVRSKYPLAKVSIDVIDLLLHQLRVLAQLPPTEHHRGRQAYPTTSYDSGQFVTYSYESESTSTFSYEYVDHTSSATPIYRNRPIIRRLIATRRAAPVQQPVQSPSEVDLPWRKKVFTTRNCGMHVHVSCAPKLAHILIARIIQNVLPKVQPFPERSDYCHPDFQSSRGARYNAVRWVDQATGHFEVRIFNGTLKLRSILHNLRLIHNEALAVRSVTSR